MKYELRAISYWPLIKISFAVNLIFGFAIGIFFALFVATFFSLLANMGGLGGIPLTSEGAPPFIFLLVIYPFLFGFGGAFINTIAAIILAFIYNLISKSIGGLEFELNQASIQAVSATGGTTAQTPGYYVSASHQPTVPPPAPPKIEPLPPDVSPPPENAEGK
jgi:hypothetical protein